MASTGTRVISRTMFCPICYARSRPKKNDWFVVYGHDRQTLLIKKNHQDGIKGYTPHIICWDVDEPHTSDGLVRVVSYCGMHECDVYIHDPEEVETGETIPVDLIERTIWWIEVKELDALITKWTNTGYEII